MINLKFGALHHVLEKVKFAIHLSEFYAPQNNLKKLK